MLAPRFASGNFENDAALRLYPKKNASASASTEIRNFENIVN